MRGMTTSLAIISEIKLLRSRGNSILEISKATGKSKSIVSKYIQGVKIQPEYKNILKAKQGGSSYRAKVKWAEKKKESESLIIKLTKKDKLLILASLYWGEGTKRELNIINSDPEMLRVVVSCFKDLGIKEVQIKATLRIYNDINKSDAISFWSKALNISPLCFKNVNVLEGKKKGKLKYGMCRIRVEKGGQYFKLIISLIDRIKILLP